MSVEAALKAGVAPRTRATKIALLLAVMATVVSGCGTFYESDYPKKQDQYIDERTGKPVPEVPAEDYGKQWPQKY